MRESSKIFSVVIPNRNTRELLESCLESIYATEDDKKSFEIIVVDNGSNDGSAEMVEKKFPQVKLIRNRSNLGFAKAVNQGWKASKGSLILFLNSDTLIRSKNTFKKLKKYLDDHPKVGCLSAKLVLRNGEIDPDCHRGFPTPWSSLTYFFGLERFFPKSKIFGQYHRGWQNLKTIHEIEAGCGASMVVRRKILEDLGGWDESYYFYGEDLDLCFRMKEAGWKIVFYPQVDILHYKGAGSGLRKESRDVTKQDKKTLIKLAKASVDAWKKFYQKFYKDRYPWIVTSLVLFGISLKGYLRVLRFKLERR